ncbi:hypothetical protein GCM10010358_13820 [Streptomyces minutiscleroticus]|uniref:Uncharacterized protein n=1 Tax=Streptomyces minutiscleroticus TaxID=68238 RepID=A0A918KEK6_9ACTN|nr:hypothetical protein GCM10010358_13820 [Streptomyces minutiscleroticus]
MEYEEQAVVKRIGPVLRTAIFFRVVGLMGCFFTVLPLPCGRFVGPPAVPGRWRDPSLAAEERRTAPVRTTRHRPGTGHRPDADRWPAEGRPVRGCHRRVRGARAGRPGENGVCSPDGEH